MEWEKYRLSAQRPEMEKEGWVTDGPFKDPPKETPTTTDTKLTPVGRLFKWIKSSNKIELAIILLSALGLGAAFYLFTTQRGIGSVGLFALVATAPLALVMFVLVRADRFSPVGSRYLILSALWGAGVATMSASVINSAMLSDFIAMTGDVTQSETLAAVVVAPVSEELLKGAGVILVLLIARHRIVSKLNGLVVAGTAGAAFAFVENIQYFLEAEAQGSAVLGFTMVGRLLLSPFIHPMATSFIGFFYASAILRAESWWGWVWRIGIGLAIAMGVHALWNGLASVSAATWLLLYFLIEVPLFTAWLIWVSVLGRRQLARINDGLAPYVVTGWMSVEEQRMVTDPRARKYAVKWARKIGKPARKAMRRYLHEAGRLGLDQKNMEQMGPDTKRVEIARVSLSSLAEYRTTYLRLGAIHAATAGSRQ